MSTVLHLFFNSFAKELDFSLVDTKHETSFVIMILITFFDKCRKVYSFLPFIYLHWTVESELIPCAKVIFLSLFTLLIHCLQCFWCLWSYSGMKLVEEKKVISKERSFWEVIQGFLLAALECQIMKKAQFSEHTVAGAISWHHVPSLLSAAWVPWGGALAPVGAESPFQFPLAQGTFWGCRGETKAGLKLPGEISFVTPASPLAETVKHLCGFFIVLYSTQNSQSPELLRSGYCRCQ